MNAPHAAGNRPRTPWIVAGFGAIVASMGGQDPAPTPPTPPKPDPIVAQLVEAHNKERAKEGLPPLKYEARLEEAAKAHARDMADRQVMGHEGGDGSTPQQRIVRAGYHYLLAGENVARGYDDVPGVMQGWMESPPHRKNILGEFTEIGVAMARGKDGKPYWSAEFGKPMPRFDPTQAASSLLERINEVRSKEKKEPLANDPRLARAAQAIAADMAKKKGGPPSSFVGVDEKLYRDLAMNTSVGRPDADSLIKGLTENPDYKVQLLGKYTSAGIGYATAEDGIPYWCLILGLPANRR